MARSGPVRLNVMVAGSKLGRLYGTMIFLDDGLMNYVRSSMQVSHTCSNCTVLTQTYSARQEATGRPQRSGGAKTRDQDIRTCPYYPSRYLRIGVSTNNSISAHRAQRSRSGMKIKIFNYASSSRVFDVDQGSRHERETVTSCSNAFPFLFYFGTYMIHWLRRPTLHTTQGACLQRVSRC